MAYLPWRLAVCLVLMFPGALAQDDQDTGPRLVAELEIVLPAGPRTWLVSFQPSLDHGRPALGARDGLLYTSDTLLLVLYEGQDHIERVPRDEAIATRTGERLRPVAGDDENREYRAYLDTRHPYFSDPSQSLTNGPVPPCHLT